MSNRADYISIGNNCNWGQIFTCISVAIMITGTILFDLSLITISINNNNITCDDAFNVYKLPAWLMTFAVSNLTMGAFFGISCFVMKCVKGDRIIDRIMYVVNMMLISIWLIFHVIMTIIGIIELVHVLPICIIDEQFVTIIVIVTIISKFMTMCGFLIYIKMNQWCNN